MKTVLLHGPRALGRVALVDDEDYEFVMLFRWFVFDYPRSRGARMHGPYAVARPTLDGRQRTVYMHALLTGRPGVDHEDHDGLNNQRSNLRIATANQNSWNARKTLAATSSQFKGVSRVRNKWMAKIHVSGEGRYLGVHATEIEAARAYDAAAREAFGQFAYLNFPGE